MKRLEWIDTAKGIGILLIVLGHVDIPGVFKDFIYSFHVPLFFLISGYLYNHEYYSENFTELVKSKFSRLVVPYFISNAIIFFITWIAYSMGFMNRQFDYPYYYLLIGIIYGNGSSWSPTILKNQLNIPSWFLLALFTGILISFFVINIYQNYSLPASIITAALLVLCGYIISYFIFLPWGIDIALISIIFISTGYFIRKYNLINFEDISGNYAKIGIFAMLFIVASSLNGTPDMNTRVYNNLILFTIEGLTGAILVFYLSCIICKTKHIQKVVSFFGKNSLTIMVYHIFIGLISYNVITKIFHIDFSLHDHWYIVYILMLIGCTSFVYIKQGAISRYAKLSINFKESCKGR